MTVTCLQAIIWITCGGLAAYIVQLLVSYINQWSGNAADTAAHATRSEEMRGTETTQHGEEKAVRNGIEGRRVPNGVPLIPNGVIKKQNEKGDDVKGDNRNDISTSKKSHIVPLSVNYHFTRKCNYTCGFCFHTAKTSYHLPISEAQRGLRMLKEAGMQKVNFSGGEPFLIERGNHLGKLVRFCKQDLALDSVSVVSNGSLIREKWFQNYGEYLDILAVSCDSFDADTNKKIGRQQGGRNHLDSLQKVRGWCHDYKVAFKINTVVNTHNIDEEMTENIMALNPCRWKVFQCLVIGGENSGPDALRNAETFVISDEQFADFCQRHNDVPCLVPESNEKMRDSYLILDEYMRFLDCTRGGKEPSRSVLDVGVDIALDASGFDETMFFRRGGKYMWSKGDMRLDW